MPSTGVKRLMHSTPFAATIPSRHSGAPDRRIRGSAPSRCISATEDGKFRCVESVSDGNGERSTASTLRPALASAIAAAEPAQRAPTTTASKRSRAVVMRHGATYAACAPRGLPPEGMLSAPIGVNLP